MAKGPFGDRVVGGEGLEGPVGTQVDKQRVDLDKFAGGRGDATRAKTRFPRWLNFRVFQLYLRIPAGWSRRTRSFSRTMIPV